MLHDERFRRVGAQHLLLHRRLRPADDGASDSDSRCCSTSRSAAAAVFRTAYYLPVVTPFVVSAILWKWLYNGDFGLINYYLLKAHIIDEPLLWLSDKNLAMPAVIIMSSLGGHGLLDGDLPRRPAGHPRGALRVGQARRSQRAGHGCATSRSRCCGRRTLFLLVIGIIGSLQVFTQIFVMTSGGPVDKTTTMVYYMYLWAFKYYDMGYASTLAFALFVMLLVFTAFQLRLFRQADA